MQELSGLRSTWRATPGQLEQAQTEFPSPRESDPRRFLHLRQLLPFPSAFRNVQGRAAPVLRPNLEGYVTRSLPGRYKNANSRLHPLPHILFTGLVEAFPDETHTSVSNVSIPRDERSRNAFANVSL